MLDASQVNLNQSLSRYIPSLTQLIGDRDFAWVDINRRFIEFMTGRLNDYRAGGNFLQVPITFYDVVSQAMLENRKYVYLFTYFNNMLSELNSTLPENKKHLLRGIVKSMLTNWDMKFLNFVGELSVLNNLLKTSFQLDQVEEIMENGKRIDFTVRAAGDRLERIEVVNIYLDNAEAYEDERLEKFVKGKLSEKYLDKTKNELQQAITLVPVLWGTHAMLLRLKTIFSGRDILPGLPVHEPMAYSCLISETTYYIKFSKLSNVFSID
jgi:hypothetical protein